MNEDWPNDLCIISYQFHFEYCSSWHCFLNRFFSDKNFALSLFSLWNSELFSSYILLLIFYPWWINFLITKKNYWWHSQLWAIKTHFFYQGFLLVISKINFVIDFINTFAYKNVNLPFKGINQTDRESLGKVIASIEEGSYMYTDFLCQSDLCLWKVNSHFYKQMVVSNLSVNG